MCEQEFQKASSRVSKVSSFDVAGSLSEDLAVSWCRGLIQNSPMSDVKLSCIDEARSYKSLSHFDDFGVCLQASDDVSCHKSFALDESSSCGVVRDAAHCQNVMDFLEWYGGSCCCCRFALKVSVEELKRSESGAIGENAS